jgi:predicted PurR-regulated permease PerM
MQHCPNGAGANPPARHAMDSKHLEQYAQIAAIALLVTGCVLVLRPFLAAMLFAAVLCLSTWPAYEWIRTKLGGRSSLAAALFCLAILLVIAAPVALTAQSLIMHSSQMIDWVRGVLDQGPFELPEFIRNVPLLGPQLDSYWHLLRDSREEIVSLAKRLVEPSKNMLLAFGGAAGEGLFQILVAVFVAFFFFRDGERVAATLRSGVGRLAGSEQGQALVNTAQNTVKGVVYGLIGTAIAQSIVALIGFLIAGVPGATLLAALVFILSFIPMGPVLIWGGIAAWFYYQGEQGWAIFMLVYGAAIISSVDNFIKPILISRTSSMSLLPVVLGVFGGALAFGFIGIFVGPVLLALAMNMSAKWLDMRSAAGEDARAKA